MVPSPERSSPSSIGSNKVACRHCGAANYVTDPVCLQCGRPTLPAAPPVPSRASSTVSGEKPRSLSGLPSGWGLYRFADGSCLVSPPLWTQIGTLPVALAVIGGICLGMYPQLSGEGRVLQFIGGTPVNPIWVMALGLALLLAAAIRACLRERWRVWANGLEQRYSLFGIHWSYRFTDAVLRQRLVRHVRRDEHGATSESYSQQLLVTDREKTRVLACPESDQPEVAAFLAQQTGWREP